MGVSNNDAVRRALTILVEHGFSVNKINNTALYLIRIPEKKSIKANFKCEVCNEGLTIWAEGTDLYNKLHVYSSAWAESEELFPGKYQIKVLDFMRDLGCTDLDETHKKLWKYLLSHPELTKSIQIFDFITGPVNIQIYKLFLDRVSKYVMR